MGKYLKLFNEMSQYEAFKDSEEYILPNVSYVENSEIVLFNPLQYIKNGVILAKFNATDGNVLALADTSNVKSLKVNGTEVEFGDMYYFNEIGEYDVEIELIDNSLINGAVSDDHNLLSNSMFYNLNNRVGACLTSIIIPDSVTSIGDAAFQNCFNLTGELIIPDSVTEIGQGAFASCYKLKNIVIPDSVTTISSGAFYGCSGLTSIVIPDSVTEIGQGAFQGCSGLTSVTCYAIAAPTIDSYTFHEVKEGGVLKVPNGSNYSSWMSTFNYYLGYYNWTIEYMLPDLPEDFEDSVIMTSESNPRAMEVCYNQGWAASPDQMLASEAYMVADIGTAFSDGYFESGEWSNPEMLELKSFDEFQYFVNVKTLSPMAFNAVSNMETIVLPPNLITIGDNAFQYCYKLKNIVIPDSVTTIGDSAFYMENLEEFGSEFKSTLRTITLGSGVTSIGTYAFKYCSELNEITCLSPTAPTIDSYTFYEVKEGGILKVPAGSDYSSWMSTDSCYLGKYNWSVEYI